jgi:multidrug efflux pump
VLAIFFVPAFFVFVLKLMRTRRPVAEEETPAAPETSPTAPATHS